MCFPEENLKAQTHQHRETGSRTKVDGRTPIPKHNWHSHFLKNEDNNYELSGKLLLSIKRYAVLSNRPGYDCLLQPCSHPEARIILHLAHAVMAIKRHLSGLSTAMLSSLPSASSTHRALGLTELWIGFAGGKNYRDIPAHEISKDPAPQKSLALPLKQAVTQPQHSWAMGKRMNGQLGRQHQISQNPWLYSPRTLNRSTMMSMSD